MKSLWTKIKEGITNSGAYMVTWLLANPSVGHGLAAILFVSIAGLFTVPLMGAAFISGLYWGRELMQARIWTAGKLIPIWDWSLNPNGIWQAAVPTLVSFLVAGLWLF